MNRVLWGSIKDLPRGLWVSIKDLPRALWDRITCVIRIPEGEDMRTEQGKKIFKEARGHWLNSRTSQSP